MALSDFKFVRTNTDPGVFELMKQEAPEFGGWDDFVVDLVAHNYKTSVTYSESSSSFIFSASTTSAHKHPHIGVSCHGGSLESAAFKVFVLMSQLPTLDANPLLIEQEIARYQEWVAKLIRENMENIRLK